MACRENQSDEKQSPVRAWLELNLDDQPVHGTLRPPGDTPTAFVGWLGLTAAIEGLRPGPRGTSAGPS